MQWMKSGYGCFCNTFDQCFKTKSEFYGFLIRCQCQSMDYVDILILQLEALVFDVWCGGQINVMTKVLSFSSTFEWHFWGCLKALEKFCLLEENQFLFALITVFALP